MVELCGARLVPGTIDVGAPRSRRRTGVALRDERRRARCSAMPIAPERSADVSSSGSASASSDDGDDLDVDGARPTATTTSPARST